MTAAMSCCIRKRKRQRLYAEGRDSRFGTASAHCPHTDRVGSRCLLVLRRKFDAHAAAGAGCDFEESNLAHEIGEFAVSPVA